MRFNDLTSLATQPGNKFEKEGVLFLTEKQEGFFRKTEEPGESSLKCLNIKRNDKHLKRNKTFNCIGGTKVSLEKWCRLRGNLLFYFKTNDPFSEPSGVIVLEKYKVVIYNETKDYDGYAFFIEFQDGLNQRLATNTEAERTDWTNCLISASCDFIRAKLKFLREEIEKKRGATYVDVDVEMLRSKTGKEIDIMEIPICESALSCDNLLCDGHGRPPNPTIVIQVTSPHCPVGWIKYGRTEVIEKCSNPQFLCTVFFWECDGLNAKSIIRFTLFDVREKISQTAVPLGNCEIALGVIRDTFRIRIPLRNKASNVAGFITIVTYTSETDVRKDKKVQRSPAKTVQPHIFSHRRSQSLPPKLGVKLFMPPQCKLPLLFHNPSFHTYRLHSGLGGDISVQEIMLESQLCFIIPQQLLSIWILREKELLQEISGIGELGGKWRNKQMDLLDKHLKLLKDYSQAKQNLQQYYGFYKKSSRKTDEDLEFAPTNLHLQRMWAHNDTLKRSGLLDVMTVGVFSRCGKPKGGGLVKLLHSMKDSPSKLDSMEYKIHSANEAVQAIKQLRKEIVEIMLQLLVLAKSKNSKGMLSLCEMMIAKSRMLLNIWEPKLVEEAFAFIEMNRIIEEPDDSQVPMSPFKKITQQLGTLDLKSPELEDFSTPMGANTDLWPSKGAKSPCNPLKFMTKSPSSVDISAIANIQSCVKNFPRSQNFQNENLSQSLPSSCHFDLKFSETHFDVNGEVLTAELRETQECEKSISKAQQSEGENANETALKKHDLPIENNNNTDTFVNLYDENGYLIENTSSVLGHNGAFLDTKVMSSSPSANYYRPTEEPEPLDLTQLNIEASVMCLVSKVKFLCGRCGSPAVRLRLPKDAGRQENHSMPVDAIQANLATDKLTSSNSTTSFASDGQTKSKSLILNSKDLNLALTTAAIKVKKGNKFTDGLELSTTSDWMNEIRPAMKKLRLAMDFLLKTARLIHTAQNLRGDIKKIGLNLSIMYRRDVCFSQALTTLVSSLMAKLWGTVITEHYINILCNLGPLACFEGLLSLYGAENDMFGDMCVAVEDLAAVKFTLIRSNINREAPIPKVTGTRNRIIVLLPVPESVFSMLPKSTSTNFKVHTIFFNIGINEKTKLAEALGNCKDQHRSNWDNFDRLKHYHIRYKKLSLISNQKNKNLNDSTSNHDMYGINVSQTSTPKKLLPTETTDQTVVTMLNEMESLLRANLSKNVKILHIAEDVTRALHGLRFTSCKSAKDRTSMSCTLEMCRLLETKFHLPSNQMQKVLNTIRSEGTRADNTMKNIGLRKYAFNIAQVMSLPQMYRPPAGSFGKVDS